MKTEFNLPEHVENRRSEILDALLVRSKELAEAYQLVTQSVGVYRTACDNYNRVLDHCRGWTIQAASVIDAEMIRRHASEEWNASAEGRAIYEWLEEIQHAVFDYVSAPRVFDLPALEHHAELEGLPGYPNDASKN